MTERRVVVVDGSNLATEGRTTPSLQQLDDAVRAYAAEDPEAEIVVVVDASFEHRVDASDRAALEEAELHGEVVSPPAGAIGRGDAFVLRIAERTGAAVLSNDSFQEFHGEHPWLFDEGRLIGGKPVPGIGWIFTPRVPVRGPKSRQATSKARRAAAEPLSPPVKAAELARAARKAAATRMAVLPDGTAPKVGDVWREPPPPGAGEGGGARGEAAEATGAEQPVEAAKAKRAKSVAKAKATKAKAAKPAAEAEPAKPAAKVTKAKPAKKAAKAEAKPAKKAAKPEAKPAKKAAEAKPAKKAAKPEATKQAAKATAREAAAHGEIAPEAAGTVTGEGLHGRTRPSEDRALQEAIDEAMAEVLAPPPAAATPGERPGKPGPAPGPGEGGGAGTPESGGGGRRRRRRGTTPPPAVNEPLTFITFVAAFPVGSEVEGEVVSFTSHGAMVDVDLPDGGSLHCYIPLAAMAQPPPTKARQVLTRGERRPFVLVGLDPPRRVAELAVPGVPADAPSAATTGG